MTRLWLRLLGLFPILVVTAGPVTTFAESLPRPLTLEQALELADRAHPNLEAAEAELSAYQAQRDRAASGMGLDIVAAGRLQWVEPSRRAPEWADGRDDHSAALLFRKPLYDFGRTREQVRAAEADMAGAGWSYMSARQAQRLLIMRHYFDALLADLRRQRDQEAMAVAFVRFDRLQDRMEMGEVSEVDVREAEHRYRELLRERDATDRERRFARNRLALALNRPGDLPWQLTPPNLDVMDRELPPLEELKVEVLANNPRLNALREHLAAARHEINAARRGGGPTLRGELEAAEYQRELGSRDPLRAGLILEIPLYQGGRVGADVAAARARFQQLQAETALLEHELDQTVTELWARLDRLDARREDVAVYRDFRDWYLERARGEYEMEMVTDLGDSMTQMSDAMLRSAQFEYETALSWARLDALMGRGLKVGARHGQ